MVSKTSHSSKYRENALFQARTQALIATLPAQIVGAGILVPLVFFSLYHQQNIELAVLYFWTALWSLAVAFRYYSYVRVKQSDPPSAQALTRFWMHSRISILLAGSLWSVMIFAYGDLAKPFQFIFILACTAFTSSAILSTYAAAPSLSMIYVGMVNLALIVKLLLSDHPETIWLAILVAIALLVYISSSYRAQKTFSNLVEARLQEQSLAEALAVEKRIAEQANASKSQFLAAASHDLRQPAHAMSMYVELLNKTQDLNQLETIKEKIILSLDTLRNHLNGLLDISRLEAGAVPNTPEHFALDGLLQTVRQSFESRSVQKGISLHVEDSGAIVYADRTHLQRILENLLSNALEYTEHGGIMVSAREAHGQVVITVADTGIGISPEHKDRIFDEFFQLHNPERDKNKGFGLGLAICKKLSELMGATLVLDSRVGQGSAFTLTVAAGDADKCTAEPVAEPQDDAALDLSGLNVLVLDDQVDIRESMRSLLLRWQAARVVTAESGEEIFNLLDQGFQPDLILADYRLRQHETGVGILQRLQRHLDHSVPAIVITGDTSARTIAHIDQSGYRMLHKPIIIKELVQALRQELAA